MNTAKLWLVLAALLGASGVALGAYRAHGLEAALARQGVEEPALSKRLQNFEVATRYQMYHALALLGVGILANSSAARLLTVAGSLFVMGSALFSGGLYYFALSGQIGHPAIVPTGGLLLILGWLSLASFALSWPRRAASSE